MSELITLSKKDPKYLEYLKGTFSDKIRAIPVQTLNVNSQSEQVTFQLIQKSKIEPAFLGLHWLQVLKVKNLLMVAFPIYLVFFYNLLQGQSIDLVTGLISALGCLFLMIAVNLQNDYIDHLSGLDRLHPSSQSHVIQKGWVAAWQMQRWSFIYMVLGGLCGARAIFLYPRVTIILAACALFGVFGMTSYKMGLRYRRWSEVTVLALLGPLLSLGIHFSMGGDWDQQVGWHGLYTGWLSLFYLHLKNFEELMVNEKANFENSITYLGFEKSKWLLRFFWIVMVGGLLYFYINRIDITFFWLQTAAALFFTWSFFRELNKLQSPIGSQIRHCVFVAQKGVFVLMILWSLDLLWMYLYK